MSEQQMERDPLTTRTIEDLENDLNNKPFWYYWQFIPYRIWHKFTDALYDIKWGFQRMFRGYDDTAYWSLDGYLTEIALPVLKWLRENKHGLPFNQEAFATEEESAAEKDWDKHVHTEESWNALLDKMILAFQIMHDEDWLTNEEMGAPDIKTDWENYRKWCDARRAKVDEGLKWFAKYYENLWD